MSNDKLKKIYGSRKRRRDVRDWTRFDGGDVYKMKGIARFSSKQRCQEKRQWRQECENIITEMYLQDPLQKYAITSNNVMAMKS